MLDSNRCLTMLQLDIMSPGQFQWMVSRLALTRGIDGGTVDFPFAGEKSLDTLANDRVCLASYFDILGKLALPVKIRDTYFDSRFW